MTTDGRCLARQTPRKDIRDTTTTTEKTRERYTEDNSPDLMDATRASFSLTTGSRILKRGLGAAATPSRVVYRAAEPATTNLTAYRVPVRYQKSTT